MDSYNDTCRHGRRYCHPSYHNADAEEGYNQRIL